MFKEDMKLIKSCIEHKDYFCAMQYAILVKEFYEDEEKRYLENLIKYVKSGNYDKIEKYIK